MAEEDNLSHPRLVKHCVDKIHNALLFDCYSLPCVLVYPKRMLVI